jgi:hypothetical protein
VASIILVHGVVYSEYTKHKYIAKKYKQDISVDSEENNVRNMT